MRLDLDKLVRGGSRTHDPRVLLGHLRSGLTLNLGDVWWIDPTPYLTGTTEIRLDSRMASPGTLYVDWGDGHNHRLDHADTHRTALLALYRHQRGEQAAYRKWALSHKDRKLNHEDDDLGPFLDHGSRARRSLSKRFPQVVFVGWYRSMTSMSLYMLHWIDPTLTLTGRPRILLWDADREEHVEPEPGSLWHERRTGSWWQGPSRTYAEDIDVAKNVLDQIRKQEDSWYLTEAGRTQGLHHKPGWPSSYRYDDVRKEWDRGDYDIIPRPAYARKVLREA